MIKNIVFDMGRVLLDYEAARVCWQFTDSKEDVELMEKELFFAEEWTLLDRGTIEEDEALKRVQERLPDERTRELARLSLAHWHEFNIEPKPGMEELVKELKEAGLSIYLCSNASLRLRVFENRIPGIKYFDGVLVSAEEKLLKPEPEIFERLFEKFSILPEESLFIDDIQANIDGAAACGMKGYCFADGDVGKLREYLFTRAAAQNQGSELGIGTKDRN